jgi:hypothetical protein
MNYHLLPALKRNTGGHKVKGDNEVESVTRWVTRGYGLITIGYGKAGRCIRQMSHLWLEMLGKLVGQQ